MPVQSESHEQDEDHLERGSMHGLDAKSPIRSISFNDDTAAIEIRGSDSASTVKAVQAQLEAAGFDKGVPETLGSTTSITVSRRASTVTPSGIIKEGARLTHADLAKIPTVLLQEITAKGVLHSPTLSKEDASAITNHEITRNGLSPSKLGFVTVSTTASDKASIKYVDAGNINPALSNVTSIREDGHIAQGPDGQTAMSVSSRLEAPGNENAVASALNAQGINAKVVSWKDECSVIAEAPAGDIATALAQTGHMDPNIAKEIAAAAEQAHPGQRAINKTLSEAGKKYAADIHEAGSATTKVGAAADEVGEAASHIHLHGRGGVLGLAVGAVVAGSLAAANNASAAEITTASGKAVTNGIVPGATDGFKNITENNARQNWLDQTLNAADTGTQTVAVGAAVTAAGATVAAPFTGGTSLTLAGGALVVSAGAGIANVAVGVAHDATYEMGFSKQGGIITSIIETGEAFAESKAARVASNHMSSLLPDDAKAAARSAGEQARAAGTARHGHDVAAASLQSVGQKPQAIKDLQK